VLADVMTDKATVEIPSPLAGPVLALGGEVGQLLAVGAELLRIGVAEDGVVASSLPRQVQASGDPRPAGRNQTGSGTPSHAAASPTAASPSPTATPTSASAATPRRTRPIASPALRARAWELGIDLADVTATGTAGRITQADIEAHLARGAARSPQPRTEVTAVTAAASVSDETHEIRIVGLRRKIAQKMQESKRRIPHFSYVEEVDVGELEALRAQLNAKRGEAHLTLLPFLIRAIVLAVREHPQINARFDDEVGMLTCFDAVHIGIATQTDAGLLVPVLRDARARDLWSCAAEVARLADRAHSGQLTRGELSGSTITLTSLGRLGGIASTPVINHPEVAIVGVNRIVVRPAIRDGLVVARPLMNLSSSFDHRVVDGANAAAFVQGLRERLEHPAMLFVE
jgi:2-oxoisovalerate dehydrogenase E2 component (dihydrolipoyl transacylase)